MAKLSTTEIHGNLIVDGEIINKAIDESAKLYINKDTKDIANANDKEFYMTNVEGDTTLPTNGWWHLLSLPHCNGDGYAGQMIIPYGNNGDKNPYLRTSLGNDWSSWKKILTQDDYNKLFQYASNGKTAIANSIAGLGIDANSNNTFDELSRKISEITNRGEYQYTGGIGSGTDYISLNNIPPGYYPASSKTWAPEIRVKKTDLARALGITADKIAAGNTICGVAGTAKPMPSTTPGNILNGGYWTTMRLSKTLAYWTCGYMKDENTIIGYHDDLKVTIDVRTGAGKQESWGGGASLGRYVSGIYLPRTKRIFCNPGSTSYYTVTNEETGTTTNVVKATTEGGGMCVDPNADVVYVFGGGNSYGDTSYQASKVNVDARTSTTITSHPSRYKGCSPVFYNGLIYTFIENWCWLQAYNPATNTYTSLADDGKSWTHRDGHARVLDGKIYFWSGSSDTDLKYYNPATNTYTTVCPTPSAAFTATTNYMMFVDEKKKTIYYPGVYLKSGSSTFGQGNVMYTYTAK